MPPGRPADRTAAERQRQKRIRDALGIRPFRLDLPEDRVAAALIEAGLLTEADAADHTAVERALAVFVDQQICVTP